VPVHGYRVHDLLRTKSTAAEVASAAQSFRPEGRHQRHHRSPHRRARTSLRISKSPTGWPHPLCSHCDKGVTAAISSATLRRGVGLTMA
jgi:hypothetical protein